MAVEAVGQFVAERSDYPADDDWRGIDCRRSAGDSKKVVTIHLFMTDNHSH